MTGTDAEIQLDPTNPIGYKRSPALQGKFDEAAEKLLQTDGWDNPEKGNRRELVADLALEGGGVKGIGLVGAVLVLHEAGYKFRGVAGTSAGAIAASLIASLSLPGQDFTQLKSILDDLTFENFMPEGKLHHFMDSHGGKVLPMVEDAAILTHRTGLYPGSYLYTWLEPHLDKLGVKTFADLKLSASVDPDLSLPAGHDYRLVVHTSDVTRRVLVRLPWDYPVYGHVSDDEKVVDAVRASMSIPFFFEPVTFQANRTEVDVPKPDGTTIRQIFEGGTVTWVDGGLLRNFPISAFDRTDGRPPRWPTIGVKLSSLRTSFPADKASESALSIAIGSLHTLMNEWDMYSVDAATAARTIFVDSGDLSATEFNLTADQQNTLFLSGVTAATEFLIEMAGANDGRVPRTSSEGKAYALKQGLVGAPILASAATPAEPAT
jgi:NTE family protein